MSASLRINDSQTFRKAERLSSRKVFETLVKKGRFISETPFRLLWIKEPLDSDFPAQAAFSVSKRNFKSAVKRNRVRRMMKEVYRKNKDSIYPLLEKEKVQLALLLIYTGKIIPEFKEVNEKIPLILNRLAAILQKNN